MLSRFHTIPACYGQTDRRTDRIAISISRVSSSMLTRDKTRRVNDVHLTRTNFISLVRKIHSRRHRNPTAKRSSAAANPWAVGYCSQFRDNRPSATPTVCVERSFAHSVPKIVAEPSVQNEPRSIGQKYKITTKKLYDLCIRFVHGLGTETTLRM